MHQKRLCLTIYIYIYIYVYIYIYTYEHVIMGVCCILDAIDVYKNEDKQQFLDAIETWDCVLGKGMDDQMFDLIKYSSIY